MKTAVDTVFVGKDRQYNRRFLRMCGHYLVEPVACTPAAGWEKGQVENQVGWCASVSLHRDCGWRATRN
jgi:transposase